MTKEKWRKLFELLREAERVPELSNDELDILSDAAVIVHRLAYPHEL